MVPDVFERKLGFGELLKASWQIFSRNFIYIFLFCFIAGCILRGLDYLTFISLPHIPSDKILAGQLKSVFTTLFGFVFSVFVILVVKNEVRGFPVSLGNLFKGVLKFFWPAFLVHFFYQVLNCLFWLPNVVVRLNNMDKASAVFLGSLLPFFVLVFMVYFLFIFQALVLREKPGASAFLYSYRMVKGRWWKIFGTMMFLSIVVLVPFYLILGLVVKKWLGLSMMTSVYWFFPIFSLFGAFMTLFFTLVFLNLDREACANPVDPVIPSKNISHETVS